LDEISMREGKFTATTATQFYDPRPFFGSQVVVDFQRLFFFHQSLEKIPPSDSAALKFTNDKFAYELEFYLSKYPDGGPYFQSLETLMTVQFSRKFFNYNKGRPLVAFLAYKVLARQKMISEEESQLGLNTRLRFKRSLFWTLKNAQFDVGKTLEEMYRSFPPGNDNFFKPIFLEVCKEKGFIFKNAK